MGGEWIFSVNRDVNWDDFDLQEYQKTLLEIKKDYEHKFERENVLWARSMDDNRISENVFAVFSYDTCKRHLHFKDYNNHQYWKLFKDPSKASDEDKESHVHGRCDFPNNFYTPSLSIQHLLSRKFPKIFEYYNDREEDAAIEMAFREDEEEFTPYTGIYYSGNGSSVFCFQGESRDYTACDSECGYCGRCGY